MRVRPYARKSAFRLSQVSASLQSYQYAPLPASNWIRLLELAPSTDSKIIQCSLKAFDLRSAPPFSAVSYTWGDSSTSLTKPSSYAPKKPSTDRILEDDESLGRIRRHPIICDGFQLKVTTNLRDALRMLSTSIVQKPAQNPAYFWIDALCVDQANVIERNVQVANMAQIFRAAENVTVWLGREDEFTADALTTIERISSIPEDKWSSISYTSFYQEGVFDRRSHVPDLTFYNWLGLIAFINRPWFSRAWVVQEIALARSAVVHCGSKCFPWEKLSKTMAFIRNTRWYHHLTTEKLRHVSFLRNNPGVYRKILKAKLGVGMEAMYLDRTRNDLTLAGHLKTQTHIRKRPPLSMLLGTHRFSNSTDPRDKVYAFLGLADRSLAPFKEQPRVLTPDYNLTVQEVYSECARALLTSYGNLGMLSHKEDLSRTRVADLPSWVPDFSVSLKPYALGFRNSFRWKANGGLQWLMNPLAMLNGQLHVQGYRIDVIDQTSTLRNEAKDAAVSWASIVSLGLNLDDHYRKTESRYRTLSRVEVLWRTLTTNTYARHHPAPEHAGDLFIDYVLNLQIRHRLSPWSSDEEFQPHHSPISESVYPEWYRLLASEPAGSPYGLATYKKRLSSVVERMLNGTYSPIGLAQLQHEFDQSGGRLRRLFKTQNKFLGTGPRSLQVGDEVWVLAGAAVPFILRRKLNGNYQLIGETYVYGLMHGEALNMGLPLEHTILE